ncbi:phosphohydrolase [Caloranaerobacter azorensis H53214]|uniref:bis(5'-nucleosyl)-tetraphosphatase (symmetrical) n=2 Tax=Caloranaerobacter azorensis TaxID=116090 RepID=A0A096BH23_9FIRM|nr:bis(5'-nucleosyl)-tetraphosphatase (symmetrical) YqeK [Caloranaerobacter azorensis]KGG80182.1 phosphohydrolase [Caloranaerobacter azorensis H53214]QIB28154.1 HD domain-containing protein [Caloranaerobacter azorensis]
MIHEIKEKLKNYISEERFIHSIGVMETAEKLAEIYGCDKYKAQLAGLLHDCGKLKDDRELLKKAFEFGIILDDIEDVNIALLHGPLGAEIAKSEFGIKDLEILNAIRYHTTGRENMNLLEKIIYIADCIEPNRDFPCVKTLRELAFSDLDKAILTAMGNTIKYVVDNGWILDVETIKARNFLIKKYKDNKVHRL